MKRLSPRMLKDQAAAGVFPHRRFGKHYRFSREDVAEIVQLTKSEVRPYRGGMSAVLFSPGCSGSPP